jgi:hypothetical protein
MHSSVGTSGPAVRSWRLSRLKYVPRMGRKQLSRYLTEQSKCPSKPPPPPKS